MGTLKQGKVSISYLPPPTEAFRLLSGLRLRTPRLNPCVLTVLRSQSSPLYFTLGFLILCGLCWVGVAGVQWLGVCVGGGVHRAGEAGTGDEWDMAGSGAYGPGISGC